MARPWKQKVLPVTRNGVRFALHRCLDCLRMIRWEEDRCYTCHQRQMQRLTAELASFDQGDNPEALAVKIREVKAAWGLSNRALAAIFNKRQSTIAQIVAGRNDG